MEIRLDFVPVKSSRTNMLQPCFIPRKTVKLKTIFKANDYPSKFFDKILQQFLKSDKKQASDSTQTSQSAYEYPIVVPYWGKDLRRFVNKFSKIIKDQLDVKINPI